MQIIYSQTLYSSVPTVPGLTKLLARVRPDRHVIFAGSRRRAAAMVVSYHPSDLSFTSLMDIVSFTGRRRPTIKEEPKSPVQPPRKRKAYSTRDASIGRIEILGSDIDTAQPSGSASSPPLALPKCDSMVSWSLPVLPLLLLGQ